VPVDLEIITGGAPNPLDYLDEGSDYWRMYPDLPARDFARFIALARGGRPEPLDQIVAPRWNIEEIEPSLAGALRAQQRRDFEESVRYAKAELGLGERPV
jgi:hypothetical protein